MTYIVLSGSLSLYTTTVQEVIPSAKEVSADDVIRVPAIRNHLLYRDVTSG